MMRYLMMICYDEKWYESIPSEQLSSYKAEYDTFAAEMGERGLLQGGERLRPTSEATTVRVQDSDVLTSDGPFAETKEQIAGYFLCDCKDLDEAIEVASKIPAARHGAIEVRPIWEM
jgi:hypothetical protein